MTTGFDKIRDFSNAPIAFDYNDVPKFTTEIFNNIKEVNSIDKTELFTQDVMMKSLESFKTDTAHQSHEYKQMLVYNLIHEFRDYYDTTLSKMTPDKISQELNVEYNYQQPTLTAITIYNQNVNAILSYMVNNNVDEFTAEDKILVRSLGMTISESGDINFVTVPQGAKVTKNQDNITMMIVGGSILLLASFFFIERL